MSTPVVQVSESQLVGDKLVCAACPHCRQEHLVAIDVDYACTSTGKPWRVEVVKTAAPQPPPRSGIYRPVCYFCNQKHDYDGGCPYIAKHPDLL